MDLRRGANHSESEGKGRHLSDMEQPDWNFGGQGRPLDFHRCGRKGSCSTIKFSAGPFRQAEVAGGKGTRDVRGRLRSRAVTAKDSDGCSDKKRTQTRAPTAWWSGHDG